MPFLPGSFGPKIKTFLQPCPCLQNQTLIPLIDNYVLHLQKTKFLTLRVPMLITLLGKNFAHFSLFYFLTPLAGAFLSLPQAASLTVLVFLSKALLSGYPITGGIPTLCATLVWAAHAQATQQKNFKAHFFYFLMSAALPALCMAVFMTHNTVGKGWVYALYWLIPMACYCAHRILRHNSSFVVALSSTFVAHAVGSVLWLFTVPTKPEQWLALIPVVALERLSIALCMTSTLVIVRTLIKCSQIAIAQKNQ